MELNLRLGADGYGTTRKWITSGGERDEPSMELCVGSGGAGTGRPSEEVLSDSAAEDVDPLLLPLLGGGGWKGEIRDERSREGTMIAAAVRKKLRLSKEQSSFLEQCFIEHHTLSSNEKLDIAKQLNLRPRQVEVWFQNRRARHTISKGHGHHIHRSKTKHMQEDCSYLRNQCKSLTEENMRLQQELLHLRQLKASSSAVIHLQPAAPCPSCKRSGPTSASAPFD